MPEVRFRPAAQRDLDDIFDFTAAKWGLQHAVRYAQGIGAACQQMAEQPDLGMNCDHVRAGYRSWRMARHRIYFRVEPYGISVVRTLHERMDSISQLR